MWLWRELPRLDLTRGAPTKVDSPLKLSSNFFEIFSIAVGWQISIRDLDTRYRQLQLEFHPDRYASAGQTEQRLAVLTASLINQAYDTLKSPLKRAQYLLELNNINADQDSHITSDSVFLMRQMALREALSDIRQAAEPLQSLEQLRADVEQGYDAVSYTHLTLPTIYSV